MIWDSAIDDLIDLTEGDLEKMEKIIAGGNEDEDEDDDNSSNK